MRGVVKIDKYELKWLKKVFSKLEERVLVTLPYKNPTLDSFKLLTEQFTPETQNTNIGYTILTEKN